MQVDVLFYARARELAGGPRLRLALDDASTLGDLRRHLSSACPKLDGFLDRCRLAVDAEFADDSLSLRHGAEVAVIPPVSGG